MNKKTILMIISAAVFILTGISAQANSAMTYWTGTDANGVLTSDPDCPLEITHETLTFDLPDSVSDEIFLSPQWDSYRNSYTAEYEIYNPSDLNLTAVLSFPFGTAPVYAKDGEEGRRPYDDESGYSVTLNGEKLEPEIRYTYLGWRRFDVNQDLFMIRDTYMEDSFFVPDLPITQYYIHLEADESEKPDGYYTEAVCQLPYQPEKSRYYFEARETGIGMEEDSFQVSVQMQDSRDDIIMTVFGEVPELPQWTFRTTEEERRELPDTWELTDEKTMTYEEYVMAKRPEDSPVSPVDYYNAVTECYAHEAQGNVILPPLQYLEPGLMKWYRYTIEVGPEETITNAVSAPAYPSIDGKYENPLQEYTYLLSPASLWKEFRNLDVIIKTDEYLTDSSASFEKTDTGYKAHYDELPEGELSFTLCADESPKHVKSPYLAVAIGYMVFMVLFFGLIFFLIIKLLKLIFRRRDQ